MTEGSTGPTILVTGGAGFLGRSVLQGLVDHYPGRIVSVNRTPLAAVGVDLPAPHVEIRADLRDHDRWTGALDGVDHVFWMAALRDHGATAAQAREANVEPLRAALAALRHRPGFRRFVFASTISALDQPPHPGRPRPMTDDSPAHPRTPYGYSKLMSERLLAASEVPHTVLRLPFLYGPGFRPGSFLEFYRDAVGKRVLSALPYTANLSLLYTGDVAGLLLEILLEENSEAADASPYVLSDGHAYEVDELISLVARVHGRSRPSVRVPAAAGRLASTAASAACRIAGTRPVARSRAGLLATYWSHAAFTRDFFVADSRRFAAAFPRCTFTPVDTAMRRSYAPGLEAQTIRSST